MSKCISSEGEYSDHELSEQPRFLCARCFAFDEDAAIARVRELEATVERVREVVSGHPKCDIYEDDDVISCGWKNAYASVVRALEAIGGDDA